MNKLKVQKTVGKIYETLQYDLFDFYIENRNPEESKNHVTKLKDLIQEGYDMPPIQVDEDGMIIDGQHRFLAWRDLEKPITYFITEFKGREQLGIMNGSGQKLWTIGDHVKSLSVKNSDYVTLQKFEDELKMGFTAVASILNKKSISSKELKEGKFLITNLENAEKFTSDYKKYFSKFGLKQKQKRGLYQLWELDGVDLNRISNIIAAHFSEIKIIYNTTDFLEFIVNKYNFGMKKYKIEHVFNSKTGYKKYSMPVKDPAWTRGTK